MFLIFGTRMLRTPLNDRTQVREQCGNCGLLSDLREYRLREYFTLFFVPVIPLAKSKVVLECERCGTPFLRVEERAAPPPRDGDSDERMVICCAFCDNRLRVPVTSRKILVKCPHCGDRFTVRLGSE